MKGKGLCGGFCKHLHLLQVQVSAKPTNAGSHLPGMQQLLIDVRKVAFLCGFVKSIFTFAVPFFKTYSNRYN